MTPSLNSIKKRTVLMAAIVLAILSVLVIILLILGAEELRLSISASIFFVVEEKFIEL